MSLRSRTESPALSEGEVLSGDEEKAISTHASRDRDGKVNTSTRPNGSSSRASQRRLGDLSKDPLYHFRDAEGDVRVPPGGRERDRSRSPFRKDRSRSRSPFRPGKAASGEKRRREDDHYSAKGGSDPRRFKVHYEDKQKAREGIGYRANRPYADLEAPEPPKGVISYDEHNSRPGSKPGRERERDRSRSPFRPGKTSKPLEHRNGSQREAYGRDKLHTRASPGADGRSERRGSTPSVHERESTPDAAYAKSDAKLRITMPQQINAAKSKERSVHVVEKASAKTDEGYCSLELSGPAGSVAANRVEQQSQPSEADIIEQRRKRREAIKARHKTQPGLLVQALEHNTTSAPATPAHDSSGAISEQQSPPSTHESPRTPQQDSPPQSPAAFAVADDEELANRRVSDNSVQEDEGPSAADYDPNMDMQEDRPDHKRSGVEAPLANIPQPEPEAASKPSKDFDMFADDEDDDMFAANGNAAKPVTGTTQGKTLDQSMLDNWDYPDGHYRVNLGELLDNRYAVQQQVGKGTFATVVRAQDTKTGSLVAIKIAANNETMYKAGQKEMDFLQLLNDNDPDDKKHIIRLLRSFDHKAHMCIVFEALSADLREVLKKFGRNVGLNLKAIRSYAQQMFLSLSHMKKCQILHADLKPDNILVSERRNLLKICDLGTAAFVTDTELTPYLVSRFYRAPEVILGMPFDYAIDMWSIGSTLFELYTGRILFAGADNNQMLRVIQECRGKIPIRMLKLSHPDQRDRHFDLENSFFSQERDKMTGKAIVRQINFKSSGEPGKDLKTRLANNAKGLGAVELKEHMAFVDLLEKCLQLDPTKRITPNDALRHSFVAHAVQPTAAPERQKVVPAMGMPRVR